MVTVSPDLLFLVAAAFSVVLAIILVVAGYLLGANSVRWTGTAGPRRLALEIVLLNVLLVGLATFVSYRTHSAALVEITAGMTLLVVPLWAGLRLRWRLKAQWSLSGAGAAFFDSTAIGVATFAAWMIASPLSFLKVPAAFVYACKLAAAAQIEFLLVRGVMELVGFVARRKYRATVLFRNSVLVYRYRDLLSAALVALLGLWVIAYVLYFNRGHHRDWFYVPPDYVKLAPELGIILPYERTPRAILANSLPPIIIMLIGLFVARRAREGVAFRFALLSLLYSLWGLDVFPRWGGVFLWTIHLLAWFLIAPVQLHFFMGFPHYEEVLSGRQRQAWNGILSKLYIAYFVMAPFFVYLNLRAAHLGHAKTVFSIFPQFIVSTVGLISVPLAWLISSYALVASWVHLFREHKQYPPPPTSGCLWQDLVQGRVENRFERRAQISRQMLWVTIGTGAALLLFLIWYLVVVPWRLSPMGAAIDALAKLAVALFFAFSTVAMVGYRLFDTNAAIIRAAEWRVVVSLIFVGSTTILSRFETLLQQLTGGLAPFLVALITFELLKKRMEQKVQYGQHEWRKNVEAVTARVPNQPTTPESVVQLLCDASPPAALGCWLVRLDTAGAAFEFQEVKHRSPCTGSCRSILAVRLKRVFAGPGRGIAPDLDACLKAAGGSGYKARTVNILERLGPWEPEVRGKSLLGISVRLCALTVEVLQRFASRRPNSPLLTRASWQRLQTAGIALIAPLGDQRLYGYYMVGTDGLGDHYDDRDLEVLNILTLALSSWLAPRREG